MILGRASLGRTALGKLEAGALQTIDILDYIGVYDTASKAPSSFILDSISMVDEYSRYWESYRLLPEVLGLIDTRLSYATVCMRDSISLYDGRLSGVSSVLTDNISLVDFRSGYSSKPISEALELVDSRYSNITSYITDNIALYDSRLNSISSVLADNVSLADSRFSYGSKQIPDSIGLYDEYSRIWSAYYILPEAIALADLTYRDTQFYLHDMVGLVDLIYSLSSRMLFDQVGLYDEYTKSWSIYREYNEVSELCDLVVKDTMLQVHELLGLYDRISSSIDMFLFDYVGTHDMLARGLSRYAYDSIGLVDTYRRVWSALLPRLESMGLADRLGKDPSKVVLDRLGLEDRHIKYITEIILDQVGLYDEYTKTWSIYREHDEISELCDLITKEGVLQKRELLGLYDGISTLSGRFLFDYIGIHDALSRGLSTYAYDDISLVDAYSRVWSALVPRFESVGLVDGLRRDSSKVVLDRLDLQDMCIKHITEIIYDLIGVYDTISYVRGTVPIADLKSRINKLIQLLDIGGL
jgi:hypothetical protein